MRERLVPAILVVLLIVLHAQLWFGRGSIASVAHMGEELAVQKDKNAQARLRNDQLAAEVQDLQEGLEMVEEKARQELGMVKPDEILVQLSRK